MCATLRIRHVRAYLAGVAALLGALCVTLPIGTAQAQTRLRAPIVTLELVPLDASQISNGQLQLKPGQRAALELRALDGAKRPVDLSAAKIQWVTSSPALLAVQASGPRAVVTAAGPGGATLSASTLNQTITLQTMTGAPAATAMPAGVVAVQRASGRSLPVAVGGNPASCLPGPQIASVPGSFTWGKEMVVTGAHFVSPGVELYAPYTNGAGFFRFPLTPYQVTATSFKLLPTAANAGTSLAAQYRLRVTTQCGTDTSATIVWFNRDPAIDTIEVGLVWRQAGTPQAWQQRVVWVHGHNLDSPSFATVGSTLIAENDVWQTDQNGTVVQVNLPQSCATSAPLIINFKQSRLPQHDAITGPQVTCGPNNQITSP